MSSSKIFLGCLFVSSLMCPLKGFSQEVLIPENYSQGEYSQDCCSQDVCSQRNSCCEETCCISERAFFNFSYHTPKSIGCKPGYLTLGTRVFPYAASSLFPFIDLRAHYLEDGRWAGNVGLGVRSLCEATNNLYGANVFYDVRQAHHHTYHQLGAGIEYIQGALETRLNLYFPLGQHSERFGTRTFLYEGGFIAESNFFNYAFSHGELEIGTRFNFFSCLQSYVGIQAYYLYALNSNHVSHKKAGGGKICVNTMLWDYFSLDLEASYDRIFHQKYQAAFTLTIPLDFGCPRSMTCCQLVNSLFAPIQREDMVYIKKGCSWTTNY